MGRPKDANVIIWLDFKIIQYDLKGVSIRITHDNEKTTYLFNFNQNCKSKAKSSEVVILDSKFIYNNYIVDDLNNTLSIEIIVEEKLFYRITKRNMATILNADNNYSKTK